MAEAALNLGTSLNDSDVRLGLMEMNPGISFDAAVNRPSEYQYVLKGGDNREKTRGGVFYCGRFICAIDRGVIPEHTVWSMTDGFEEIRMCDIERYDDSRVIYVEVLPSDKNYHVALLKAQKKDDNFQLDGDGRVFKYKALRECRVRDQPIRVGWRHTLLKLVQANIPGVTIDTLNERFGVRL